MNAVRATHTPLITPADHIFVAASRKELVR